MSESYSEQVHPRIRGEYFALSAALAASAGSPPHTRGIPLVSSAIFAALRFTPAYAGNTSCYGMCVTDIWVHPRIRGEYRDAMEEFLEVVGSPPHTRGIRYVNPRQAAERGFTPAYAGNTSSKSPSALRFRVHPRIRGEYSGSACRVLRHLGSPPHTRGIL